MIDLHTQNSHILMNERLPAAEKQMLTTLVKSVPLLAAHVWIATSGTTGSLKMTALSKKALLASAFAVNRHLEATATDVWACVLPTFHVGGLAIFVRAAVSGSRVVQQTAWDPRAFVELCRTEGITLTSLVPAQLTDLVRESLEAPPSIRAVVVGGGATPRELYDEARALGWPVLPSYGMTETSSQVATAKGDSPELLVLDHFEARTEEDGRLAFKGESLLTGYAELSEDGVPRFVQVLRRGWLITNDIGELDGRVLRVFGRVGDFVKIGGESVDLQRLDGILASIAGTAAAVIAIPDERLGHVIHLAIAAGDAAAIEIAFNERVAPFERSRRVHRVDAIPRTDLGKLKRSELAQSLQ
jgi:o-succinylbenzoate---CoA ligase